MMDEFVVRDLAEQLKALVGGISDLNDTLGEKFATLTNEEIEQPEGYLGATGIHLTPLDKQDEPPTFEQELVHLINKHGMEKYSNTPDWVLANFLCNVLKQFDCGVVMRDGDETIRMMRKTGQS